MTSPLTARLVATGLATIVLAACTTTVPSTTPEGSGPASSVVVHSKGMGALRWKPCHGDFQCASLEVPIDWFGEKDSTIDLAVVKLPATGDDPIGSLLVNPGGPGESGVKFLTDFSLIGEFPDEITENYDIVSWDPRGTGDSSPVECTTEQELLEPAPLPLPPVGPERDQVGRKITRDVDRCLTKFGDLVPYLGTRQTVEDLDALSESLGDDALTYLGYSYGTAIGLEYLEVHPDRVKAMVLDGVVLPGEDPVESTHKQITSFEDNLTRFLDQCAASKRCKFGDGRPREVLEKFLTELQSGTRIPADYQLPDDDGVQHSRKGKLGYSEAIQGIILPLYSRSSWPYLEIALRDATAPDHPDGGYLLMFRDQMMGRQLDGTWSHSSDAFTAIGCADQSERATDPFGDLDLVEKWTKELPFLGEVGAVGLPGCFGWPAARWPVDAPTEASLAKSPPTLLVNATHDSATPYSNAETIAGLLPTSALVTVDSENHTTVAQGNACVDDVVVAYLLSGKLPTKPPTCSADGD